MKMNSKTFHAAGFWVMLSLCLAAGVHSCAGDGGTEEKAGHSGTFTMNEVEKASYLLGVNIGDMVKGYRFDNLDRRAFYRGFRDRLNARYGTSTPGYLLEFEHDPREAVDVINDYLVKRHEWCAERNARRETAYFTKLAGKKGVQADGGILFEVGEPGNDERAHEGDTVLLSFTEKDIDGRIIRQSAGGRELTAVKGRELPGLDAGLSLVGEGGRATLHIPSASAYGDAGTTDVEPNLPVVWDIAIIDIKRRTDEEGRN